MKTKLIAIALVIASFTLGYGQSSLKIEKTQNPSVFNLTYHGANDLKAVVVKIMDQQENVLVSRNLHTVKDFNLPLNFNRQEKGKYIVTVNHGKTSETQELFYGVQSDNVLQKANLTYHTAKIKNGHYVISVPQHQVEIARITVLDQSDNVLFTTTKKADNGAAFLLNMKNIEVPTTIVVTDAATE